MRSGLTLLHRKWYSLSELSVELEYGIDFIEHAIISGQLKASVFLGHGVEIVEVKEVIRGDCFEYPHVAEPFNLYGLELYDLYPYSGIEWKLDDKFGKVTGDVSHVHVINYKNHKMYSLCDQHRITKEDIFIRSEEVNRIIGKYQIVEVEDTAMDFMNSDHPYYAPELAEAVNVWRTMVKREVAVKDFKNEVARFMEKAGYGHAAVDRISVLTNPKAAKSGGAPKKSWP